MHDTVAVQIVCIGHAPKRLVLELVSLQRPPRGSVGLQAFYLITAQLDFIILRKVNGVNILGGGISPSHVYYSSLTTATLL